MTDSQMKKLNLYNSTQLEDLYARCATDLVWKVAVSKRRLDREALQIKEKLMDLDREEKLLRASLVEIEAEVLRRECPQPSQT